MGSVAGVNETSYTPLSVTRVVAQFENFGAFLGSFLGLVRLGVLRLRPSVGRGSVRVLFRQMQFRFSARFGACVSCGGRSVFRSAFSLVVFYDLAASRQSFGAFLLPRFAVELGLFRSALRCG